jgi:PPK2 family polyphosphate:nucleotide phosphotransferase
VDLAAVDSRNTPGFAGSGKSEGRAQTAKVGKRLAKRQEQLYAQGRAGGDQAVLLVLQGMDTSGKGGTVKHVTGLVNPMGVRYHAFGPPTAQERSHHFLWRIRRHLPGPGAIGVFDRSHYEDVLVARVHELVPPEVWQRRYDEINRFEADLHPSIRLVKCFLHISPDEQRARLAARLDKPSKYWKYDPKDLDERAHWLEYQQAYADALRRCHTDTAPWYVVPADRKWYRDWAISHLLLEQLDELGLGWPAPDGWDPAHERRRLAADEPRPVR